MDEAHPRAEKINTKWNYFYWCHWTLWMKLYRTKLANISKKKRNWLDSAVILEISWYSHGNKKDRQCSIAAQPFDWLSEVFNIVSFYRLNHIHTGGLVWATSMWIVSNLGKSHFLFLQNNRNKLLLESKICALKWMIPRWLRSRPFSVQ